MEWKPIIEPLLEKLNPIGGRISHRISPNILRTKIIDSIWVEFQFESYNYIDPFYGETEAPGNFDTFFETTAYEKRIPVTDILQIENQFYDFEKNPMTGNLSNSIDLKIQYCKFGKIRNRQIEFEMKFYLTNSDSYGMMNGTEEEHSSLTKVINVKLDFQKLKIESRKTNEEYNVSNFINSEVYDLKLLEKTDEINWRENRKYYCVPIKKEKIL